ncbi:MAG: TonB-dependent receptor, partial [Bacteroidota bacterium]
SITGKVVDQQNRPIEFAEILLLQPDSTALLSELADEQGQFTITRAAGNYLLQIRQVGQVLYSQSLDFNQDMNLGILVVEKGLNLDEIVVTAKMKLINRKIDRTVFNIENTANANGGDALELLKITPGMRVQNEEVKMIGKSTVGVLMDGKIMQIPQGNIADFLRSIPAENIKSIEVITTPPAKFDAAGNSGLINIVLKKARSDSWNALLAGNYWQKTFATGTGLANFNFNQNKFTLSSSLYFNPGKQFNSQEDYASFPDGLWYTDSSYDYQYRRVNARLLMDYQVTSAWTMGLQYLFNTNDQEFVEAPFTPVFDYQSNEVLRSLRSDGFVEQNPTIHSLNWHSGLRLDTLGRYMTINLDYFTFSNEDRKSYDGKSEIVSPAITQFFGGRNVNDQDITNLSAKIDFDYPTPFMNLSFGGKITNSKAINTISAFNSGLVNDLVTNYPLERSIFEYVENIQAIYLSGNRKLNQYWEVQLGLRLETTQTEVIIENQAGPKDNDYHQFFPTAYVAYRPNQNSTYSLSYNRRIRRPSFMELNPNLYFSNPFQSIEGNPFLQPAFIDNVELAHNYKSLQSKIYFSNEDAIFSQIAIADPATNNIRYTNENFITTQRYGISENHYFDKISWWTSSNGIDVNYTVSTSDLAITNERETGFNARISTYNNFILNKKRNLSLSINYWYNFPGVDGIYQLKAMGSLGAGMQYRLLDNKLTLSLRGFDILKTEIIGVSSTVNDTFQEGEYYYDNQSVLFSINYKFGNTKIRDKRHQTGNADERSRTGN